MQVEEQLNLRRNKIRNDKINVIDEKKNRDKREVYRWVERRKEFYER